VRPPRLPLLLVLAAVAVLSAPAARADDGLITFAQQGKYFGTSVAGIDPAGGNPTDIADIPGGAITSASWAPQGDRIAFATDALGHPQVVLATVFDEELLNTSTDDELDPAFAPDGATLAVAVQPFGGHARIALFTAAGGKLNTGLTPPGSDARAPHWSPDGKQIAFDSDRNGSWDVFLMNADGTNVRDVTPTAANEHVTDWSPDGLTLLVTSDANGNSDLYRVSLSTGGQTRLTNDVGNDIAGVFAPSGTKIAFSSDVRGFFEVYTMQVDGSGLEALTDDQGRDIVLDWQARPSSVGPVVKAYPATIQRGKALTLRYSVKDDDPYDSVSLVLTGESANGGGEFGGGADREAADGRIVTTHIPALEVTDFLARLDRNFRFCVGAIDPVFNGPSLSCAKLTLKKPKPAKRKR
jgi:Tol biopolymer transport system component